MPLPPMYFPVYNMHFRLPDPGVHAQPLVGSPPVPHVEGIHLVQWLLSDQSKLTTTVLGDSLRFALKDYDTGKLIPHVAVPPMLGPFLADTILNSKYLVLFNQPDIKLEDQEIGIFFWAVAPTWRCQEIKMPFPPVLGKKLQVKFQAWMRKLAKAGVDRKAAAEAKKRIEEMQSALEKLHELKDAAEDALANDTLSPAAEAKNEKKQAKQKEKYGKAIGDQAKASEKARSAQEYADAVDAEEAAEADKSKPAEDPIDKAARENEADDASKAAKAREKAALQEKKAADKAARRAQKEADQHDAKVKANLNRDTTSPTQASQLAVDHQEQADAKRKEAEEAKQASKKAEEEAKAAKKAGSDARKQKSAKDRNNELGREHKEKFGKGNPYKDATGIGNLTLAWPSYTGHIPFPCTIQIYMGWDLLMKNWLKGALNLVESLLNAYVGIICDSLAAGRGKIAQALANLAKAVTSSALEAGKTFVLEQKIEIKVSTKIGFVTTEAELKQDPKTKEWSWKAKIGGGGEKDILGKTAEGKIEGKAEGKIGKAGKDEMFGDATVDSWSGSGNVKVGDGEVAPSGSYTYGQKHVDETKDASGNVTAPAQDVTTHSGSLSTSEAKGTYSHEKIESADGSHTTKESRSFEAGPSFQRSDSTTTTTAADGSRTVTRTTETVTPQGKTTTETAEPNAIPTQNPAAVDYSAGAPVVGAV